MKTNTLFHMRLLDAGYRLFSFQKRLGDLRRSHYLSETPLILIRLLDEIGERLICRLVDARTTHKESEDFRQLEEIEFRVQLIAHFVTNRLFGWLDIIELARPEHNPQELVNSIEWLASRLSHEAGLMMCPYKWQPVDMSVPVLFPENYAFVDVFDALMGRENTDMEDLLQEVLGIHRSSFEAYPKHMGVLLFSNPVKDNFLQHAALGHELGHFADRVHKVRDSISETTLVAAQRIIDADRDQLVDEFLEARLGKDTKARAKGSEDYESVRLKLVAYLNDELQKLNDSWQGEIIADVFAIRLLGPAAFFAIGQYLLMHLGPLRRAALSSTTHPSVLLRLKVMIRELDDLLTDITFRDDARILAEAIEEWRELVTDLSAQAMPPSGRLDLSGTNWGRTQLEVGLADRIYAHLESTGVLQSMQDEIRQVITRVGDVPGHRWLLPSSHDFDQLPYAIRMLRLGVPPSEKPRDLKAKLLETADVTAPCLSLATILNTGWAYEFERWREPTSWSCPDDVIQFFQGRQERLDSVVKCAVEQSNLVRKTYGS